MYFGNYTGLYFLVSFHSIYPLKRNMIMVAVSRSSVIISFSVNFRICDSSIIAKIAQPIIIGNMHLNKIPPLNLFKLAKDNVMRQMASTAFNNSKYVSMLTIVMYLLLCYIYIFCGLNFKAI